MQPQGVRSVRLMSGEHMPSVEIRIAAPQLGERMDEVRRWLRERGCAHTLISTGSSDERVVVVEFVSDAQAAEFARRFSGSLASS
jgi:hypothetical protein